MERSLTGWSTCRTSSTKDNIHLHRLFQLCLCGRDQQNHRSIYAPYPEPLNDVYLATIERRASINMRGCDEHILQEITNN